VKHQPDNPMRCRSVSLSCKGKINHLIRLPEINRAEVLPEHKQVLSYGLSIDNTASWMAASQNSEAKDAIDLRLSNQYWSEVLSLFDRE